jgi:hypothetical protein
MSSAQNLHPASVKPMPQVAATGSGSVADPIQRSSECLRFATGEWLIDESWRNAVPGSQRRPEYRRRLYFQNSAVAPCECMGEIAAAGTRAAVPAAARPLLLRSGERCAIVLDHYVFQRWQRPHGPYWYGVTTLPFGAAAFFLRNYLRQRDADAARGDGLNLPDVPYAFGHLDIERNVLVTSRQHDDPRFPQFLVYSAPDYGTAWQFDAERSRRVNGIR